MKNNVHIDLKELLDYVNSSGIKTIHLVHVTQKEVEFFQYLEKLKYINLRVLKTKCVEGPSYISLNVDILKYIKPEDLNMKSNWSVLKDYINSKEIDSIIDRKHFKKEVNSFLTTGSFDRYCKCLSKLFVLENLGKGSYKVLRKVPHNMTTQKLFILLNDNSWKEWFMPLEDRLNALN